MGRPESRACDERRQQQNRTQADNEKKVSGPAGVHYEAERHERRADEDEKLIHGAISVSSASPASLPLSINRESERSASAAK